MRSSKTKKNQRLTLEEAIKLLNQKIQNWEDTDPAYMDENLKSLRHKVMYVHMRLEASLEYLVVRDLVGWDRKKLDGRVDARTMGEIMAKMSAVFERMQFRNKVEACRRLELIIGKFAGLLLKVNDYRKHFKTR